MSNDTSSILPLVVSGFRHSGMLVHAGMQRLLYPCYRTFHETSSETPPLSLSVIPISCIKTTCTILSSSPRHEHDCPSLPYYFTIDHNHTRVLQLPLLPDPYRLFPCENAFHDVLVCAIKSVWPETATCDNHATGKRKQSKVTRSR